MPAQDTSVAGVQSPASATLPDDQSQVTAADSQNTDTSSPSASKKIIQPINDLNSDAQPKIYELYEKEMAQAESGVPAASTVIEAPAAAPTDSSAQLPLNPASAAETPAATPSQPGAVFDPNQSAL
jgi:hypothetical protein